MFKSPRSCGCLLHLPSIRHVNLMIMTSDRLTVQFLDIWYVVVTTLGATTKFEDGMITYSSVIEHFVPELYKVWWPPHFHQIVSYICYGQSAIKFELAMSMIYSRIYSQELIPQYDNTEIIHHIWWTKTGWPFDLGLDFLTSDQIINDMPPFLLFFGLPESFLFRIHWQTADMGQTARHVTDKWTHRWTGYNP